MPARPPGRRTRYISATASGVVPHIPRKLVTTSNDAGSHGRACISPTLISHPGFRSRATATSRAEASIPQQEAPRRRASSTASPDPHATSSSRSPASTPSRWCTATYSRQLPGSLSVAKSTALRPQPSSTTTHWEEPVLGFVIAAPFCVARSAVALVLPVCGAGPQGSPAREYGLAGQVGTNGAAAPAEVGRIGVQVEVP